MIVHLKPCRQASELFAGWQETMIWSCLQGVMGELYADHAQQPTAAAAVLGDFCFLAGAPHRELVLEAPARGKQEVTIVVPQNEAWAEMIEYCFEKRAKKVVRYATRKDPADLNAERLRATVRSLPDSYTLHMIDERLFRICGDLPWCRDLVAQYPDYDAYRCHGLGFAVLREGEVVAGASSYSSYLGGIEIEIDTKAPYRRKGLAYACGAKLILACLARGWYASWDAQNLGSLALAQKLGYRPAGAYTAYEVSRSR